MPNSQEDQCCPLVIIHGGASIEGDCNKDLRDHFVAQELESFEDIYCDPVVCVDVECLDYVAKAHSCLKPELLNIISTKLSKVEN